MAKNIDLTNIPTKTLINELYRRQYDPNSEVFNVELWVRKDVEAIVPADKVDDFMKTKHQYFSDRITELGWELMGDLV
jgi:chorismate mutase